MMSPAEWDRVVKPHVAKLAMIDADNRDGVLRFIARSDRARRQRASLLGQVEEGRHRTRLEHRQRLQSVIIEEIDGLRDVGVVRLAPSGDSEFRQRPVIVAMPPVVIEPHRQLGFGQIGLERKRVLGGTASS